MRPQGQYGNLPFLGSSFLARSHCRKKRLLISSRPSVRPSLCVYVSAAPIGRISVTRDIEDFMKIHICKENLT